MSLFHCVIHLLQFPSMTTTSAAQLSCKFNRRSHTRSRSGFIQDKNTIESNHNLEDMKPKEEPKKPSNGSSLLKEKVETYKECRKNHAANIGGYAVDGCREFMPAGEEGTSAAFKCAACSCHRNFHRREIDNDCYSCDCSSISTTPK